MADRKREKILSHELTTQRILRLIKEKGLKQGEKLPTERELAATLGISRTSLREALQNLEANGIVRIRQGSGIFLDIYDESMIMPFSSPDLSSYREIVKMIMQMAEARKMIEIYSARQAAEVITPEQLSRLCMHEEEEYERLSSRRGQVLSPGLDFEQVIVEILGNPVISNMHKRLNSSWKSYLATFNAVVLSPNQRHRGHLLIIRALEERDPIKAGKTMSQHLEKSIQQLEVLMKRYQEMEIDEVSDEDFWD